MDKFTDYTYLEHIYMTMEMWVYDNVFIFSNLIQLCLLVLTLLVSWYLTPSIKEWRQKEIVNKNRTLLRYIPISLNIHQSLITSLILPIIWLLILSLLLLIGAAIDTSYHLIKIAVSLLTAWVIISLTTGMLKNKALSKFIMVVVWTVAALNILNLIDPVTGVLDGIGITLGELRISALTVIEGFFVLIILLWLAIIISQFIDQQIKNQLILHPR